MPTKKTSRLEMLREDAKRLGLWVAAYSPGDGVTRYRFTKWDKRSKPMSYFRSDGIYTALGIGQAETWLSGYRRRR